MNASLLQEAFPSEAQALASEFPPYVVSDFPVSRACTVQRKGVARLFGTAALHTKQGHFDKACSLKVHPLDAPPLLLAGVTAPLTCGLIV